MIAMHNCSLGARVRTSSAIIIKMIKMGWGALVGPCTYAASHPRLVHLGLQPGVRPEGRVDIPPVLRWIIPGGWSSLLSSQT